MKTLPLFAAALALLLSACSTDDDSGGGEAKSYEYCVYAEAQQCFKGPYTACPGGGSLANNCPFGGEDNQPSSSSLSNSFTDTRDGKTYKTVKIGEQVWMAENLNYNVSGSKCYDNLEPNCNTYGRLYNWVTAMSLPLSCNSSTCSNQIQLPHRGICPAGWHLPTNAEWDKLYRFADASKGTESPYDSPIAGRYLKDMSRWHDNSNGTNQYGFSALPGGGGNSDGSFYAVGIGGIWWSADDSYYYSNSAYGRIMGSNDEGAYWDFFVKSFFLSLRCVRD